MKSILNWEKDTNDQNKINESEHVILRMECPRCNSKEAYCESSYDNGYKDIVCPDCDYFRHLIHAKSKTGYFVWWNGDKNNKSILDLVNSGILNDEIYALYFIHTTSGRGEYGKLKTKSCYDNFIEYLAMISQEKHNMVSAAVVTQADHEALEFNFKPYKPL